MSLKQIIEMLSKGSAQAVTTLRSRNDEASKLKEYLYVRTPVEKDLRRTLDETDGKCIVFLCGSSGDGKSEIFRRVHRTYGSKFNFHLDATHSFDPGKDAIQTLNDKFAEYKAGDKPLAVGINIGMLGNFAADGDAAHSDIKNSINDFLALRPIASKEHVFINFENFTRYPKFELDGETIRAPFIGELIERICLPDEKNPIYVHSRSGIQDTALHRNYALLCIPEVQRRICSLLYYAHLKFDQFLTARTVLDFVYQILTGKDSLFDNLFCGQDSELFDALRMLDPCHARSKSLDLFQIKTSLNLLDADFAAFKKDFESRYHIPLPKPRSWVRLFYVMQDVELGNNYHHRFKGDLQRELFDEFQSVWQLHRDYSGAKDDKRTKLRDFYGHTLISAVISFANRFAPEVRRDRFLLAKPNGYALSATLQMQPDLSHLATERPTQLRSFEAYLKVGDYPLKPIPVSVTFLELARKINQGYRPNTHDKTTVVKLEELVDEVRRIVKTTQILYVQRGDIAWSLLDDTTEDELIVNP